MLADSSLQVTSNDQLELAHTTAKQKPADYDQSISDSEQSEKEYNESSNEYQQGGSGGNESSSDCEGSQDQTASSTACATEAPKRPTAAGMLPAGGYCMYATKSAHAHYRSVTQSVQLQMHQLCPMCL